MGGLVEDIRRVGPVKPVSEQFFGGDWGVQADLGRLLA